jgi:hypothetical protein
MSEGSPHQPWYRSEPWLAICFSAFIPIILALVLPESLKMPLLGVGVLLAAVGLALLVRKELHRMKHGDVSLEQ